MQALYNEFNELARIPDKTPVYGISVSKKMLKNEMQNDEIYDNDDPVSFSTYLKPFNYNEYNKIVDDLGIQSERFTHDTFVMETHSYCQVNAICRTLHNIYNRYMSPKKTMRDIVYLQNKYIHHFEIGNGNHSNINMFYINPNYTILHVNYKLDSAGGGMLNATMPFVLMAYGQSLAISKIRIPLMSSPQQYKVPFNSSSYAISMIPHNMEKFDNAVKNIFTYDVLSRFDYFYTIPIH